MNDYDEIISDFRAQERWLFSLITDPEGKRYFEKKSRDTQERELWEQLDRTADFLRFAGHPERGFKSVHVAGTSGKGSVTTMIAGILSECGLPTGHLTSPYLQLPTEKLMYNGRPIAPSEFAELVRDFRVIYEAWKEAGNPNLRYGEAWVSLKYLWLAKRQVAWGVVETGVGGRYDPTNALPAQLAVITNVDYDHVKTLGPELSDIAWHKAGIIKEGQLAITAASNPTVLEVIRAEAARKGATLYALGQDFDVMVHESDRISVQTPFNRYDHIRIKAKGAYQLQNAGLAIAAVDVLAHHNLLPNVGGGLGQRFASALAEVTYAGRMEIVSTEPLVVLDGAHNPAKMQALVHSVQSSYPNKRLITILGALLYKDVTQIVEILEPISSQFIATQPHVFGKPATPAHMLAEKIRHLSPTKPIAFAEQVHDAIEQALALARPDDLLLITGSLYLVGEARAYWYPTEQLLRESEYLKNIS
ncbi:MAG: bifunctional folylpolyglutamate synthase/dihydrofolate synthase [Ardenticatenaceae bacterium]